MLIFIFALQLNSSEPTEDVSQQSINNVNTDTEVIDHEIIPIAPSVTTTIENAQNNERIYKNESFNENIEVIGEANSTVLEYVTRQYDELPDFIKDEVGSCCKLFVTDSNLNELTAAEPEGSTVLGLFFPDDEKIYLSNNVENLEQLRVLEHEVGHFIDSRVGTIQGTTYFSCRDFFVEIFELEKENLEIMANYYNLTLGGETCSKSHEYFADCFSLYLKHPEILKKYCPATYEAVEMILMLYDQYRS